MLTTAEIKTMFGEFIKQIRERQRLGLREFCLENGCDPSNWSKIEREVLAPRATRIRFAPGRSNSASNKARMNGSNSSTTPPSTPDASRITSLRTKS